MNNDVNNITGGRFVGRRTRRTGGRGGETYFGQFKVTPAASGEENKVDISEGKVINGSTVTTVPAQVDLDISGFSYISLEVWYDGGWSVDYLIGASYPTQDKKTPGDHFALRVLISEKIDEVWRQQHFGEIHNTRIVKD
jgi:hypothetical protein